MSFLLLTTIIISILAFCFCIDLLAMYRNKPRTEEDQLTDDLINDIITFEEFEERFDELVKKNKINKLKKERIEKIKKINNESR